ncbi:glycosyltransferase [Shewanella sp. 125m-1]
MKFSVLMSVYSKEKPSNLIECLDSLLVQTVLADEVVLVQDGPISSDLIAIINNYRSRLNIISIQIQDNVGLASALNVGLQKCSYNLVARMDTDDVCYPTRFEKQLEFMAANPAIVASSGAIEEMNESMDSVLNIRVLPTEHTQITRFAKSRSPLSHPASIFKKDIVVKLGGYPALRKSQDYGLWSKLLVHGYKLGNTRDTLLKMRCGDDFYSRRGASYFKHEVILLRFQREIGFLNSLMLYSNLSSKFLLRYSPVFLQKIAYRLFR